MDLIRTAVEFEEKVIGGTLLEGEAGGSDMDIKNWADGVGGHYERKRRVQILDHSRNVIVKGEQDGMDSVFHAEVELGEGRGIDVDIVPVQAEVGDGSNAWNLDDEVEDGKVEENGWGFDDDAEVEPESEPLVEKCSAYSQMPAVEEPDPDPADAWGWNEDEESSASPDTEGKENIEAEETAWDDPWGDEPSTIPIPALTSPTPKPATRLEKFTSKAQGNETHYQTNGNNSRPPTIPALEPVKSRPPPNVSSLSLANPPKEMYLVSMRTKEIIKLVQDVLHEGEEFATAKIISSCSPKRAESSSSSRPGTLLLQTATSILDFFRALYPVRFGSDLAGDPKMAMRFSNDCLYLSGEVGKLEIKQHGLHSMEEKLGDCKDHLKVLGDIWYDDTIVRLFSF